MHHLFTKRNHLYTTNNSISNFEQSVKKVMSNNWHNCSNHNCNRPIFCLTLCRACFRGFRVKCNVEGCHRPSFCKQVCSYHYRKKEIPPIKKCSESGCEKVSYIDKCFSCYTKTYCLQCSAHTFARNLCQKHYMREYRFKQLK